MPFVDDTPRPSGGFVDSSPAPRGRFVDDATTPGGPAPAPTPFDTDSAIKRYATQYGVPPDFAERIRRLESGGTTNPATVSSPAGARGVFQLMPDTFRAQGVGSDITNPDQNIHAGIKYLAEQLKRYGGDQKLAAAAYNAGPGAVDKYHGVPPYQETQAYVKATAAPRGHFVDASSATPHPQQSEFPAPPGLSPVGGLWHGVLKGGTDVMGGLNTVMGAPQRAVAGALTGDFGATIHPFDEQRQNALEARTEALPGVHQAAEEVGAGAGFVGKLSDEIMQAVGHPTHNEQFLQNVGKVFAAQTITDPLTYVPLIGEARMANGARRAWELASKGAEAVGAKVPGLARAAKEAAEAHEKYLRPAVNKIFGTRPGLDPFLDTSGKAARLSIEEKNTDKMAEEGVRQNDLARKYAKEIRGAKTFQDLPYEVQQESMREAWRYGIPEMRAKVEHDPRFGFKPTQEDLEKFEKPAGVLKYDPRKDYVTLISPKPPKSYAQSELFQEFGGKTAPEFSGFEKHARPEDKVHDDMYDRIVNRWRLGRNLVQQRMVDRDTKDYLLAHGGSKIPVTAENVDSIVAQLERDPVRFNIPGYTDIARRVARGGIQLNPLPHGLKNIGDMAELGGRGGVLAGKLGNALHLHPAITKALSEMAGGMEAFGVGLGYAAKGLTDAQISRMKNMGSGVPSYMREAEGPVTRLAQKIGSQGMLQRLELGFRQALLDQLDREGGVIGHLPDEYAKAQKIRDALGDYRNINAFTSALQAIGGPFVAFRTNITPQAVARAALRAPGRVEARARASTDVNQELHKEGQSGTFNYGGPVEDVARMVEKPLDYLTSAATIGPVLSVAAHMARGGMGPTDAAKRVGEEFIPAWQEILPALKSIPGVGDWLQKQGLAYREPPGITPLNDALNMVFGSHFENPTSKKRLREIESESYRQ